ncbi:hypothetical protein F511_47668 [Dorcoceras hygrometricum]|uniref:Uncharacterized protein n=1 Tax=Dorcoceras hygrometricum TaxID=472368 RepID=A0A2Z6ZQH6_9LAMI|nr:hypothetical protein F511_47668 [Dorcoceras hygrometricum]
MERPRVAAPFPAPSPLRRAMMARFVALLDARRGWPAAAHHRATLCRSYAACCVSIVRRWLAGVRPRALVRRARFFVSAAAGRSPLRRCRDGWS